MLKRLRGPSAALSMRTGQRPGKRYATSHARRPERAHERRWIAAPTAGKAYRRMPARSLSTRQISLLSRRNTTVPLVPPKPNEFDSTASIGILRAAFGHVVQIAVRIRVFEVNRRRRDLIADRQHGEDRFDSASGAEQMPGHRLGRTHRKLLRVVAEGTLDRVRLGLVAQWRGGRVGVDVLNLIGVQAAIAQCIQPLPAVRPRRSLPGAVM